MILRAIRSFAFLFAAALFVLAGILPATLHGQVPASSSSAGQQNPSSSPAYKHEKSPSLIDPAGPTISLISAEPVFLMAAALNACGYDEGLEESEPVRKEIRAEMNQALDKSEDARAKRDSLCLFIAQHRMTGTDLDVAQYISLALYLTPPPEMELSEDLSEMPPDSTQVAEIVPLLRDFVAAVDLHGIWLGTHHIYDQEQDQLHDSLSKMIVDTNLYLKMPAVAYEGQRFIVIVEPQFSPHMVNARIYGDDYVVVVSPQHGQIRMSDVRDTYLHYMIDPLLYTRANAVDRMQPLLRVVRDAPLDFRLRSDSLALTIECLIKAIEARTMDTGIPVYKIPAGVDRSELPRYEHERQIYQQQVDDFRMATVRHDMTQGFVLTLYFYKQLIQFEKDPASLTDTIGEMVYSIDVDEQVHQARQIEFDKVSDSEVLGRSVPRKLTGLDLAEARLEAGDVASASAIARQTLKEPADTPEAKAAAARADFILARAAILTGHAEEAFDKFRQTLAISKNQRQLAWSHIYLGRMLDLDCKRDQAISEYNAALAVRDWRQDTRLAAERGVKTAYAVKGHNCNQDADEGSPGAGTAAPEGTGPEARSAGQAGTAKPQ